MRFRLAKDKGCKKTGSMAGKVWLIKLSRRRSDGSKACWLIHNGLASAVVAVILFLERLQLPFVVS